MPTRGVSRGEWCGAQLCEVTSWRRAPFAEALKGSEMQCTRPLLGFNPFFSIELSHAPKRYWLERLVGPPWHFVFPLLPAPARFHRVWLRTPIRSVRLETH
jgi:hypothetical protein